MLGRSLWDAFPDFARADFEPHFQEALRLNRPVRFEAWFAPYRRWVEVSAWPDEDGLSIYSHDITEARAQREELARQRALLDAVLEASPNVILLKDGQGRYIAGNRQFERVLSRPLEQILGHTIFDMLPEEEARAIHEHDLQVMQRGEPIQFQEELPLAGGVRTFLSTKFPLPEGGLCAVSTDITERQELQEINEALLQVAREVGAELDLDRLVQLVTDVATRATGAAFGAFFYNVTDVAGESYTLYSISGVPREAFSRFPMPRNTDLFGPTFRGEGTVRIDDVRQDGRFGRNDPYFGMPPGHLPVTSYLAVPVRSLSGEVIGGLFFGHPDAGVFRPRHERVIEGIAAQTGVAMDNARLYQEASRAKARLEEQNAVLASARIEAEAANRAKGEFLAHMSHELRTPLNGVLGMLHLLLDSNLSQEQQEHAQLVRLSALNLQALIEDVLDFSRIEAGRIEIREERFHLHDVIAESLAPVVGTAEELRLRLASVVAPELPDAFVGDRVRLRQILVNLLSNAVKFTHEGYVLLRVERAAEGLRFQVEDTGIGIPEELREAVFEPFRQGGSVQTGGTGLGLAISRQLAQLMGGRLWVEPRDGPGTRLCLVLPLRPDEVQEPVLSDTESARLRDLPVHLVTRDPHLAEALRGLLHGMEVGLDVGSGCEEGLGWLAGTSGPRLVFLDLSVPEGECEEFVRTLGGRSEVRVVAIPSIHQPGYYRELSAVAYLRKPVTRSSLLEALRLALGLPRSAEASRAEPPPEMLMPHLATLRVLLGEDNPINQRVVAGILRRHGYEVIPASTGKEVLQRWGSDGPFDVVVLDVQMPELSGFEVARRIRDEDSRIPILALTARARPEDRDECLRSGMDLYLTKPVRPELLLESIHSLVRREG